MRGRRGARFFAVLLIWIAGFWTASVPADGYTPHAPISIDGDANFTPGNGVTGGSGTLQDPYVIEAWDINATTATAISLQNTRAHVVIRNVFLHTGFARSGIQLSNTENVRIENSTVDDLSDGIVGWYANRTSIVRGTLTRFGGDGIRFGYSNDISIAGVEIADAGYNAIEVFAGGNVSISGCMTSTTGGSAVYVVGAVNVTVDACDVRAARDNGVDVYASAKDVRVVRTSVDGALTAGVAVSFSDNVTVSDSDIRNATEGVLVSRSNAVRVEGNRIHEVKNPIQAALSTGVSIVGNDAWNATGPVLVWYTPGTRINGNTLSSTGVVLSGDSLEHFASHTISDNTVNGLPLRYYRDCASLRLDGDPTGQLILANCQNVRVSNLTVRDADVGIELAFVRGVVIEATESVNHSSGAMVVVHSWDVMIRESTLVADGTGVGVEADHSERVVLVHNRIGGGYYSGPVAMGATSNATVSHNRLGPGRYGILLDASPDATIEANTVANAAESLYVLSSPRARVFHNNVMRAAVDTGTDTSVGNVWDDGYTSGGNWWWDYAGADDCSGPLQDVCSGPDGIGDAPYWVDIDTRDRYPLMRPYETPPAALFTVTPAAGTVATPFSFDAGASWDLLDDPASLEVRWDWEDDGTWDIAWSTAKVAQHSYLAPGTPTVRLQVRDTSGLTSEATRGITIRNTYPTAKVSVAPAAGNRATDFAFDASDSSDLEDPAASLEVRWDFEGDGVWDTPWSVVKTVTHRYLVSGTYAARLWVRDTSGLTNETTKTVTVTNDPPRATLGAEPTVGDAGTSFTFDASGSSDPDDPRGTLEFRWDWEADGTWDTPWSDAATASRTFATSGTRTVRVEVRDPEGRTDSAEVSVTVSAPSASAGSDLLRYGLTLGILAAVLVTVALAVWLRRRSRGRGAPPA